MPGPVPAAQGVTEIRNVNLGLSGHTVGVDIADIGRIENLHPLTEQLFLVGGQCARVGVEVFICTELKRIDENTDDNYVAKRTCFAHQVQVPLVQIAHGRYKSDVLSGMASVAKSGLELSLVVISSHIYLIP